VAPVKSIMVSPGRPWRVVVEIEEGEKGTCEREKKDRALDIAAENGQCDYREGHDDAQACANPLKPSSMLAALAAPSS